MFKDLVKGVAKGVAHSMVDSYGSACKKTGKSDGFNAKVLHDAIDGNFYSNEEEDDDDDEY